MNASARYVRLVKYVILYRIRRAIKVGVTLNCPVGLLIKIMNFMLFYFGCIYTSDGVSKTSVK